MKYRNGIVIVYILIMLGALAGLWFTTGGKTAPKRDMVAYNDELHRIGKAYLEGQARESIEEQFSCKLELAGEPEANDALNETLDDEQLELFEEFMTAQREVNVLTDCETFCYAFKLGARIMLDILTEGEMKEI